jgi:3-oxoacyl-[acyl-carrier-protein] synthase-3
MSIYSPAKRAIITGTGGYLPAQIISNDDLSLVMDTSHEWIYTRTGIAQRHKAENQETTVYMACQAAQKAIENAQLDPQELDLILLATSTPDYAFPAGAAQIQQFLQSSRAISLDMNVACSGFLFALVMAENYLQQNKKKKALVVGAETLTKIVNWSDRNTAVLFGDGAGAVVLSLEDFSYRGILGYHLASDGQGFPYLHVDHANCAKGHIVMAGKEVFRRAVLNLEKSAQELLGKLGITMQEIDWLVPHQANKRIIDALAEKLKIGHEKVIYTGGDHANTSSASIPLALWEAYTKNIIKKGDIMLIQAFGAGFTWGACLVRA